MNIQEAKRILDQGKLVAVPTETVYGLAANAFNSEACELIFKLKKRPQTNPLIVHLSSIEEVYSVAKNIPPEAVILGKVFWPGPLTIVLEKQEIVPSIVTAGQNTVAVRVPNHPLLLELLKELDYPIAAPSANKYQSISPTQPSHVLKSLGNVPILDGGVCSKGIESTIVGFKEGKVVVFRHGSITAEDIESQTSLKVVDQQNEEVKLPGQALKHYSPTTKFIYTNNPSKAFKDWQGKRIVFLKFTNNIIEPPDFIQTINMIKERGISGASEKLYAVLHDLDQKDYDVIIAEQVNPVGIGKAINDKLIRAQNI